MTPLGITAATTGINTGITGANNILGSLLNQFFWERQANKSFQINEKAADNAMQRSIDMYNLMQSPQAMVKQLKEAGLSKSLIYGKGSMGGQTQTGPQGNGPSGMVGANLMDVKQIDPLTLSQIANINADTKLKDSKRKKTDAEITTEHLQQEFTRVQTMLGEQNYNWKAETWNTEMKTMEQTLDKLIAETKIDVIKGYVDEQTANTKIKTAIQEYNNLVQQGIIMEIESRKMEQAIENMKAEKKNIVIDTELKKEIKKRTEQETEKLKVEWNKITEETNKIIAETGNIEAGTEYLKRQKQAIDQDYNMDEFTKKDIKFAIDKLIENKNANARILNGIGRIIPG